MFVLSEGDASQALRTSVKGLQASDCRLYLRFDVEAGEAGSSCPGVTADLTDLLLRSDRSREDLLRKFTSKTKRQKH